MGETNSPTISQASTVNGQFPQVDTNTRIWRFGKKVGLGDLTLGDRLVVQTRACKKGTDVTAPLLATRVLDRPAKTAPTTTTTS